MESERRKSERIKKLLMVQFAVETDDFLKWDMSTMKDLSEGGLLITAHRDFDCGTILKFRFKLPSDPFESLTLKAKVVSSEKMVTKLGFVTNVYSLRLAFIDMGEEHKEMFRQYVKWFTSKKGGGK